MKTITIAITTILFTLCSIMVTASAQAQQQRPGGFANIPWGTSLRDAKHIMEGKPGIQRDAHTTASHLGFTGGTFAAKPAVVWGLEFVDSGLYRGAVILKAFADRSKDYEDAKSMLEQVYGRPSSTSKKGRHSRTIWKFPADLRNKDVEVIELWNNPDEQGVKITYRNETMKAGEPSAEL